MFRFYRASVDDIYIYVTAVIIIVHDGLQSIVVFRDLRVCTRMRSGRKDAEKGDCISEVNLGCDRGSAGAGAPLETGDERTECGKRGEGARGGGGGRQERRKGSGGNGPGPARASDAPMPPISSS